MITRKCKQCGKEFTLTNLDIDYYSRMGMQLPKRCKQCREMNPQKQFRQEKSAGKLKRSVGLLIVVLVLALGLFFESEYFPSWYSDVARSVDANTASSLETYSFQGENTIFSEKAETVQGTAETVQSKAETAQSTAEKAQSKAETTQAAESLYKFRNADFLAEHYEKHGISMGFATAEEYEKAASRVISSPDSLHKTEKEDGDDVYYLDSTNEFVILSTDGYIRTYFSPDDGKDYFDRQ